MDEIKIQANLVFDNVSGDLVGFIDLGDPMTNFASLSDENEDAIASLILTFLVRRLCTDLNHIIAYFFTGNFTSYQIMPLFCMENCCCFGGITETLCILVTLCH